jgi:hypothetical protein
MKFKRFFLASFFLALLFSLTACTIPFTNKEITLPFFEKKAEVALGEMREKMDSVPYYKSDVDFSLNFKINVDKIKCKDDMLLVNESFGLKKYWGVGRSQFIGNNLPLVQWLSKELDESELSQISSKTIWL